MTGKHIPWNKDMKGHLSKETIEKMSKSKKGMHYSPENKPYVVPCPTHIHKMFGVNNYNRNLHYQNINAFLGIINIEDPEIPVFKHVFIEGDI